jgi:CRP/FNR family transcriptional regulator, cyclic AMP receptor protein
LWPWAFGETSNHVFFVLEGRAQASLVSLNGREVILRELREGDLFGDLAAIDQMPRSASIEALSDCTLARIPRDSFVSAVTEIPDVAAWMCRRLTGQIRDLTERLFELNALRVRNRLHCELLRMCGSTGTGPAILSPAPTHSEFASRIGTHREAITRELGYLADQGIIEQGRRQLVIRDIPALERLVREALGEMDANPLQRSESGPAPAAAK